MNVNINVKIVQDDDGQNPREWEDHYGLMACSHRRYTLGDVQIQSDDYSSWDEVEQHLIKKCGAVVILPLWLYDHSGISISTRSFIGRAHHAEWDSGQVGFIYATRESIDRMMGWKKLTKTRLTAIEGYLQGEVETYDQYLRGDVYGYTVEVNGEEISSCWGFFGEEHAKDEAISIAQLHLADLLSTDLEVSYA